MIKRIKMLLAVFFALTAIFTASGKTDESGSGVPLVINDDDKVFMKIAASIGTALPRNVQILTYNIFFLNCDGETSQQVGQLFHDVLQQQQKAHHYKVTFIDDVRRDHPEFDYSFMNKMNDQDLIAFGKNISNDVVFISSVTLLEGKYKRVWDKENRKFVRKRILLFQGNIFSTATAAYMLRVSEYFLVN